MGKLLIKKSSGTIVPYLTNYFNHYMHTGIFPGELKLGRITSIDIILPVFYHIESLHEKQETYSWHLHQS